MLFQGACDSEMTRTLQRQLYLTDSEDEVTLDRLRGVCIVFTMQEQAEAASSSSSYQPPAFWCTTRLPPSRPIAANSLVPLQRPIQGCPSHTPSEKDWQALLGATRLPAADLYSGGGGTVLAASRFFSLVSAVDMDLTSCDTLQCALLSRAPSRYCETSEPH